jgi:hypothetical protein
MRHMIQRATAYDKNRIIHPLVVPSFVRDSLDLDGTRFTNRNSHRLLAFFRWG